MPIQVELHDSSSELDSLDPLLPINLQPLAAMWLSWTLIGKFMHL